MKNNLLIVWTSGDVEVAKKFPLLYSSVMLDRKYWEKAHLMIWGPSILLAKENTQIREKLVEIIKTGVKMSACIVCVEDYEAKEELEALGIEVNHTGELFTKALKDDDEWAVVTI
ncbi:DsrE family protein [Poseidonibacter lekithochrous]|uniref:DsrE family protein n=1 Tax=Poseidonibacter lekithochrous TaxID=1904463 RepID=UPI0008FCA68B|nr:DsrE family protein [Poseidonibacter lekithochrous]QKJ23936.1 DsrE/DsrF-like family protein [Poseidonibacter lekithochrous]